MKINVLDKGYVKFLSMLGDDFTPAKVARISYNDGLKGEEQDRKLMKYLWDNKHSSCFEQNVLTFEVKCPIFVARQWMRHRTMSYNEVSRRYTADDIEFYYPEHWRLQDSKNKQNSDGFVDDNGELEFINYLQNYTVMDVSNLAQFERNISGLLMNFVNVGEEIYEKLIEHGVAKEMARMFLPVNMYTRFIVTVNLRNLLHFLELRNSPHAQYEIRVYAEAIEEILKENLPTIMEIISDEKS